MIWFLRESKATINRKNSPPHLSGGVYPAVALWHFQNARNIIFTSYRYYE